MTNSGGDADLARRSAAQGRESEPSARLTARLSAGASARSSVGAIGADRPQLAAAFLLAAVGAAIMAFSVTTDDFSLGGTPLLSVLTVGGVGLAILLTTFGRGGAEAAFLKLYGGASCAAALSRRDGRLIATNAAFRDAVAQEAGAAAAGAAMGDALAATVADGPALVYRLANRAGRDGVASEAAARLAGGEIVVRAEAVGGAAGARRLIWTVGEGAAEAEGAGHAEAAYAFARLDRSGAALTANPKYDALPPAARQAASDAAAAALEAGRGDATADLPEFGRAVIAARAAADGAREITIFRDAGARDPCVIDTLPVALAHLTPEGEIVWVNAAAAALLGPGAARGAGFADLVEGLGRSMPDRIAACGGGADDGRSDLARAARAEGDLYLQVAFRRMKIGGAPAIVAVLQDATDLEARERQFVQSQKMLAVGQLAGGVAHDFNNLLTAILGHCDLMAMRRDEADPDFQDLMQIRQNANRAAALVRQLLAFSRQQKLDPEACDLTDALGELSHLLDRLIGERVVLSVSEEDGLWPVWVDQRQFEQVIVNLVVNARDAMPEGGEIDIRCANVTLAEELKRDRAVVPTGDYVRVTVADQGEGMTPEAAAQAFEPFFTTKRLGEGTGLGLSTAYGIVKQTGGFIFVDSEPGAGAVFTLLIPRLTGEVAKAAAPKEVAVDLSGSGKVLLVEDEAPVRAFAARALRLRGYEVTEAEDAEAALNALADPAVHVDLVVSDIVMPGIDGPAWVQEARRARPDLSVIFTSGYDEDVFRKGLKDVNNCAFLPKPFTLDDLGAAVKAKLGDAAAEESRVSEFQ